MVRGSDKSVGMTIYRTDIATSGLEVGPKSSELSLIWNLVTRIGSLYEGSDFVRITMAKTGEEVPGSELPGYNGLDRSNTLT